MDRQLFQQMAEVEDRHWWFTARRQILTTELRRLALAPQTAILEIGCGTGGNLAMLQQFGTVQGMECDLQAQAIAQAKQGIAVKVGALPDAVPFSASSQQLIAMLDVLEHIAADETALTAVRLLLRPPGYLLITVPAFPWLWSGHDELHHHVRRYTQASLRPKLVAAGFEVRRMKYFNSLLLPLIALTRAWNQWRGVCHSDIHLPNPMVNWMLHQIFAAERYCPQWCAFPAGVSLFALAQVAEYT